MGSSNNGATKAEAIRRKKDRACGPDRVGHAAEGRRGQSGRPIRTASRRLSRPFGSGKNVRSCPSYRQRMNGIVYYAFRLISCQPRLGTRPGGLGEIQAVTPREPESGRARRLPRHRRPGTARVRPHSPSPPLRCCAKSGPEPAARSGLVRVCRPGTARAEPAARARHSPSPPRHSLSPSPPAGQLERVSQAEPARPAPARAQSKSAAPVPLKVRPGRARSSPGPPPFRNSPSLPARHRRASQADSAHRPPWHRGTVRVPQPARNQPPAPAVHGPSPPGQL